MVRSHPLGRGLSRSPKILSTGRVKIFLLSTSMEKEEKVTYAFLLSSSPLPSPGSPSTTWPLMVSLPLTRFATRNSAMLSMHWLGTSMLCVFESVLKRSLVMGLKAERKG